MMHLATNAEYSTDSDSKIDAYPASRIMDNQLCSLGPTVSAAT